eukprot:gene25673-biopygen18013
MTLPAFTATREKRSARVRSASISLNSIVRSASGPRPLSFLPDEQTRQEYATVNWESSPINGIDVLGQALTNGGERCTTTGNSQWREIAPHQTHRTFETRLCRYSGKSKTTGISTYRPEGKTGAGFWNFYRPGETCQPQEKLEQQFGNVAHRPEGKNWSGFPENTDRGKFADLKGKWSWLGGTASFSDLDRAPAGQGPADLPPA